MYRDISTDFEASRVDETKLSHGFGRRKRRQADASKNSRLFKLARVLVRFDHVARFIVNANHSII
jgi:hypothetical protein